MLRARGNKGELVALALTNQPGRARRVFVNHVPMDVERTWMHGDQLIFKFAGVNTISDAERLAGADVTIPIEERTELPEGEYFQADLIGCEVIDTAGRSLGTVTDFQETGGTPLVHVGSDLLIPFARSICVKIDTAARRIEVQLPEGLENLNAMI